MGVSATAELTPCSLGTFLSWKTIEVFCRTPPEMHKSTETIDHAMRTAHARLVRSYPSF
ncbi:hypothetical protein CPC08DRAFT_708857 [Agrocybe pediades]|nr:hypothetical protein CPC08DRAFT_708857 [Agrocybe pediades]